MLDEEEDEQSSSKPQAPRNPPLTLDSSSWTVQKSIRYKDAAHPNGYDYYFNAATGESIWDGDPTMRVSKRRQLRRADGAEEGTSGGIYFTPSVSVRSQDIGPLIAQSDGHIVVKGDKVKYFCDRAKKEKFAFETNSAGLELLCYLVRVNQEPLRLCNQAIDASEKKDEVSIHNAVPFFFVDP